MKRETEESLVLDRPYRTHMDRTFTAAAIQTVLFHVHDDGGLMDRVDAALAIARACGAHLRLLHVTPIEAYTIVDAFGTFVNHELLRTLEDQAANLRRKIEERMRAEDVTWDFEERTGELVPRLAQGAALADLVVTGREKIGREFGGPAISVIGDLLDIMRTPLLVVGNSGERFDPFAPAVIGWNGSFEAANAVRAAVPMLRMASEVRIVQFSEEKSELFPSTALLEYLSRHGIAAELDVESTTESVADALVEITRRTRSGLLVAGAYSHSRAGEFFFGGVTRSLLKDCPVALLTAR